MSRNCMMFTNRHVPLEQNGCHGYRAAAGSQKNGWSKSFRFWKRPAFLRLGLQLPNFSTSTQLKSPEKGWQSSPHLSPGLASSREPGHPWDPRHPLIDLGKPPQDIEKSLKILGTPMGAAPVSVSSWMHRLHEVPRGKRCETQCSCCY